MVESRPVRISLADEQNLFRQGFRALAERSAVAAVVSEASTGKEAIEHYATFRPDVAIVEIRFPDICGVDVIRSVREQYLTARFIVLSSYDGDEDIYRSLQAGAKAYLPKTVTFEEVADCIARVHRGETIVPPAIAAKLANRTASQDLTERELEVLRRMVAGRSNKEIAADLHITEGTVKSHVVHVLEKLAVHDRTQAVTAAIQRGLVRMDFPPAAS